MLLCLSFPPFGWWYAAIVAFALLAWVLTREATTLVGGFGYGFLFGAAFYIPLLPWTGVMVGSCRGWRSRSAGGVSRACSGCGAVVARRLTGWPIWFAGLWALAEWAKSTVPFGGFPWGVVGFGQTDGPLLPLAQIGGAPLVSFAVTLLGFGLAALAFEIFNWWRRTKPAARRRSGPVAAADHRFGRTRRPPEGIRRTAPWIRPLGQRPETGEPDRPPGQPARHEHGGQPEQRGARCSIQLCLQPGCAAACAFS